MLSKSKVEKEHNFNKIPEVFKVADNYYFAKSF